MLSALETITTRIREYNAQIEKLTEESYPEVALLKQVRCWNADRVDTRADVGRPKAVSKEPRCWLLRGTATGQKELRAERTSTAYHQGGRLLSAHGAGTRGTTHPGPIRRGLRSTPMRAEAG